MPADYIERLKKVKNEKKMKADELSAASGVPLGTLTKIFSGVSDSVKLGNMVSICDALGVSLDYIITGVPDNLNNFTLDGEEIRLIEDYRRLDKYGRDLVSAVIAKERERSAEGEYFHPSKSQDYSENRPGHAVILTAPAERKYRDSDARRTERRFIPLCELPVSAGPGEFLDSSSFSDRISVPHGDVTDRADFAVRISGDSMMPRYRDGDILLVESSESVEPGEPCIYVLDGCGYFKIFGGDCLLPLNKKYEKIMLRDFESVSCSGRVIGRVKKK